MGSNLFGTKESQDDLLDIVCTWWRIGDFEFVGGFCHGVHIAAIWAGNRELEEDFEFFRNIARERVYAERA